MQNYRLLSYSWSLILKFKHLREFHPWSYPWQSLFNFVYLICISEQKIYLSKSFIHSCSPKFMNIYCAKVILPGNGYPFDNEMKSLTILLASSESNHNTNTTVIQNKYLIIQYKTTVIPSLIILKVYLFWLDSSRGLLRFESFHKT